MKLEARVLDAGDARRAGVCAMYVTQGERSACVAARLEFGDVLADSGERSLSEFEVTLFAPVSEGEAPRVRARRWHSYEGGTSTLRDVWVEVRATTEGALSVGPSSPAPAAQLVPRATARWRLADGGREPTVT
jgi:hypothetical protein